MENNNNMWKTLALFLFGMTFGFLIAPIKHGIRVKVMNNGSNRGLECDYNELADDDYEDCYYEEDVDDDNSDKQDCIKF